MRSRLIETVRRSLHRPAVWAVLGLVWLGGTVAGLTSLMQYDNEPGVAASAPLDWPSQSAIARDPARPTLVMLAHPRCDCTQASVGELAELMARARHRPRAFVVFIRPGGVAGEWEKTSLWDRASRIPDVAVLRDDEGQEARRFGVETSGQTLLYDADGRLIFSGGTTAARGRAGDNAGRATLLAWLNGDHPAGTTSPVFGCSLFAPAEAEHQPDAHTRGAHGS